MADGSGDKEEGSTLSETRISAQLLKTTSGEFDLESIFHLSLRQQGIDDLGLLGSCTSLQTLDLSRNDLTTLDQLATLKQLVSLNIAANRITTLDPLKDLESLRSLNAAGNLIASVGDVLCLSALQNLEDLRLQDTIHEWTNPICNSATYRSTMTTHFCQLKVVDGMRMSGKGSEVFTLMRQLDKTLAKYDEPPLTADIATKSSKRSWIDQSMLDSSPDQNKVKTDIDDTEKKLQDMLLECRMLGNSALHKIQQS